MFEQVYDYQAWPIVTATWVDDRPGEDDTEHEQVFVHTDDPDRPHGGPAWRHPTIPIN